MKKHRENFHQHLLQSNQSNVVINSNLSNTIAVGQNDIVPLLSQGKDHQIVTLHYSYPDNQQPFQGNAFTAAPDPQSPMEVVTQGTSPLINHLPQDLMLMIDTLNNEQAEPARAAGPHLHLLQQAVPH